MKIKLELSDGKKINLTPEQAREVYDQLNTIFSTNTWSTWPQMTYTYFSDTADKVIKDFNTTTENIYKHWEDTTDKLVKFNS